MRSKSITRLLFALLFVLRIISLFVVKPNNAPDELGHLVMVKALSEGRVLTLQQSMDYIHYPYAIYHPVPYLPYMLGMKAVTLFQPELEGALKKPIVGFPHALVYAARIGGLFWFLLFAVFLLRVTEKLPTKDRILSVLAIGLIPQLTFVQSYVNLDAMGVGVMAYLLWALKEERWWHITLATALVAMSKLNFYCLALLPMAYIILRYHRSPKLMFGRLLQLGTAALICSVPWFLYNFYVVTGEYHSFLGFDAMGKIMNDPETGGMQVFGYGFLTMSVRSTFAYFSWMNVRVPRLYYPLWAFGFVIFGNVAHLYACLRREENPAVKFPLLIVGISNWFLHYAASYQGAFQPQGRYLFPAIFISVGYAVWGYRRLRETFHSDWFFRVPVLFFLIVAAVGLYYSHFDPDGHTIPDVQFSANVRAR